MRDPEDLRVLREEAAREARLRRGAAPGAEAAHPGDGAQSPPAAAAVVPARPDPAGRRDAPRSVRPARASEAAAPVPPLPEPDFRRARTVESEAEPERTRGGRGAFLALLTVAAILTAVYLLAPRIAEAVPAAAPVLADYVRAVDGLRTGTEGALDRVLAAMGANEG